MNNLTEQDRKDFKIWATSVLRERVCTVVFTKTDGSERSMQCTLNSNLIPIIEKKTDRTKTINENVLSVYDVEAKGWRSFRVDSVKQFNFTLE